MHSVHKRVVYLNGKRQQDFTVLLMEFSPVKQWNRVITVAGIRVRNVGIGHPGERGKLENIVAHGAGKIFLLVFDCFACQGDVFLKAVLHFHLHDLEHLCVRIQIGKGCIDPVKNTRLSVHKAAAERLDFVGASGNGIHHGKCEGTAHFPDLWKKMGYIQIKGYTVLGLQNVPEYLIVHGSVPI